MSRCLGCADLDFRVGSSLAVRSPCVLRPGFMYLVVVSLLLKAAGPLRLVCERLARCHGKEGAKGCSRPSAVGPCVSTQLRPPLAWHPSVCPLPCTDLAVSERAVVLFATPAAPPVGVQTGWWRQVARDPNPLSPRRAAIRAFSFPTPPAHVTCPLCRCSLPPLSYTRHFFFFLLLEQLW